MEKLVCPHCKNPLLTIDVGSGPFLEFDEDEKEYTYSTPSQEINGSCGYCQATLPKPLVEQAFTSACML